MFKTCFTNVKNGKKLVLQLLKMFITGLQSFREFKTCLYNYKFVYTYSALESFTLNVTVDILNHSDNSFTYCWFYKITLRWDWLVQWNRRLELC
jgi:hypothetical protein